MTDLLEIDRLTARIGRTGPRLLREVSLNVPAGEVHGLVGESGAGKSMIGKAIAGLLPPAVKQTGGHIRLHGTDLDALSPGGRRKMVAERCAIIPQDPLTALNPCRRIGGQITDRLIHILGWERARAEARARDLLDEVAIRDPERVMRAYPHELSGGMRQRILIAAAFAAEPELIIADECTTALDVTVQRQILKLIAEMQARHGTALLFVTHDMGVVAKICQSVSVLFQGKVVAQGRVADFFSGQAPHPYAHALIAATPRYDRPGESLLPVPQAVLDGLRREIEADDAAQEARHG